jgi:hypothetical protein
MITGSDLIAWGYTPGPWFSQALSEASRLAAMGIEPDKIRKRLAMFAPEPVTMLARRERGELPFHLNIEAESISGFLNLGEVDNIEVVVKHMDELMRAAGVDTMFVHDHFWNEHNFVWQKSDGLFYHGKGATPAFPNFAADTNGLTLIPMNMAEPILIARGLNAVNGLGFAPHGAGRNMSRTAFKRTLPETDQHRAAGLPDWLDARWFSGTPDTSEMPGGYKNAESVRRQIARFGLAEIVDEVLPFGCIMAGEIDWRNAGKTMGEMA